MRSKSLIITLLCLVAFNTDVFCQKTLPLMGNADEYTYDDVGNRIKREYKWTIIALKNNNEEQPVDTLNEQLSNSGFTGNTIIIKAYPNPVADELIVENLSWKDGQKALVKISDIAGRLLIERSFSTAKEKFPLSSFMTGTYTVSYYLGNHLQTTWKIIKK